MSHATASERPTIEQVQELASAMRVVSMEDSHTSVSPGNTKKLVAMLDDYYLRLLEQEQQGVWIDMETAEELSGMVARWLHKNGGTNNQLRADAKLRELLTNAAIQRAKEPTDADF